MEITGIICEYNPLHLGHQKQLDTVRRLSGQEQGIVCLMSGNFVQRGHPAAVDKLARAQAAVLCGADLVLELPVTACLSSAEGFAAEGVRILSGFCDRLCFGAENAELQGLVSTAQALLSGSFAAHLRGHLDRGLSFPAARQSALLDMGINGELLSSPNNILAVEYCKAILSQGSTMVPMPIHREGSYHDCEADPKNPSATALREMLKNNGPWLDYVPAAARSCFENAVFHSMEAGERAVLAQLRRMTDTEFEALPYGSEGLWRKLMHAARKCATLEEILTLTKSRRYTRTRLDRMVMCAFLGITGEMLTRPAPYTRVLAFNDRGRQILKLAKQSGSFPNIGAAQEDPYQMLEARCGDLYGLFAHGTPGIPGSESLYRVYHHRQP